jgi:glycine betaine/proline transport system permease protein
MLKADALEFVGVDNAHADPVPSIEVSEKEYGTNAADNKIDDAVDWMVTHWRSFFIGIRDALLKVMLPLEHRLVQLPWWAFTGIVALLAWRISGMRVALLSVGCLLFLAMFGLWSDAMSTTAIVGTATFISVAVAVPVGIAMSKSNKLEGALRPVLDLMQVMPSFVYLIPAIFFLGLGLVPAMLATMVYAMPPAMRLTNLGIRLVSPQLKEAARAFGTTDWQMLLKVELPMARPTIMAGVNQTIMMALAMVVVASLVGSRGLGKDVLAGIAQLETGRGLMAGLGIVAMAIVIDRISQGFAKDPTQGSQ